MKLVAEAPWGLKLQFESLLNEGGSFAGTHFDVASGGQSCGDDSCEQITRTDGIEWDAGVVETDRLNTGSIDTQTKAIRSDGDALHDENDAMGFRISAQPGLQRLQSSQCPSRIAGNEPRGFGQVWEQNPCVGNDAVADRFGRRDGDIQTPPVAQNGVEDHVKASAAWPL
jgi:hypothetical protein